MVNGLFRKDEKEKVEKLTICCFLFTICPDDEKRRIGGLLAKRRGS
jgi:hypothetical protein